MTSVIYPSDTVHRQLWKENLFYIKKIHRKIMDIHNIVFTKNRPMQLYGYLDSLQRLFGASSLSTSVPYKRDLFHSEYEQLFAEFPRLNVIVEDDFHRDLLSLIRNTSAEYLLFGVDDVMFFASVSMEVVRTAFARHEALLGFSLRLGLNGQVQDDVDAGNVVTHQWAGERYHLLNWTRGMAPATRYPFELCATIYKTREIQRLVESTMKGGPSFRKWFAPSSQLVDVLGKVYSRKKLLRSLGYFYNPNTFESWCCRYVQRHQDEFGNFLAFQKICATAIQINLVNTSTNTDWVGDRDLTVEMLNEQFRRGKRPDIDYVVSRQPTSTHVDRDYFRIA
jgi:hypothetical protein